LTFGKRFKTLNHSPPIGEVTCRRKRKAQRRGQQRKGKAQKGRREDESFSTSRVNLRPFYLYGEEIFLSSKHLFL
jgi:hypothetical protein